MSRVDKATATTVHRAPLNAAISASQVGDVLAVGLNSSGNIVLAAGQTGIVGVICPTEEMEAGQMCDYFTDGTEIADFTLADGSAAVVATQYYGSVTTGAVTDTNTGAPVGHTKLRTAGATDLVLVVRIGTPAA